MKKTIIFASLLLVLCGCSKNIGMDGMDEHIENCVSFGFASNADGHSLEDTETKMLIHLGSGASALANFGWRASDGGYELEWAIEEAKRIVRGCK